MTRRTGLKELECGPFEVGKGRRSNDDHEYCMKRMSMNVHCSSFGIQIFTFGSIVGEACFHFAAHRSADR